MKQTSLVRKILGCTQDGQALPLEEHLIKAKHVIIFNECQYKERIPEYAFGRRDHHFIGIVTENEIIKANINEVGIIWRIDASPTQTIIDFLRKRHPEGTKPGDQIFPALRQRYVVEPKPIITITCDTLAYRAYSLGSLATIMEQLHLEGIEEYVAPQEKYKQYIQVFDDASKLPTIKLINKYKPQIFIGRGHFLKEREFYYFSRQHQIPTVYAESIIRTRIKESLK